MNRYLDISIGIMLLLLLVGQAYETYQISELNSYSGSFTFGEQTGQYTVNGTDTTYSVGEQNLILGISLEEGIMVAVIAVVALITVVAVSGLTFDISETAEKAIVNFAIFGGFWGIFSTLMYSLIITIPLGLGWFGFFIISILHFFGILKIIYK